MMATMIPVQGTINGYTYEFVNKDHRGTWYKLTIPSGVVYLVQCTTDADITLLTTTPELFWMQYQNKYPAR